MRKSLLGLVGLCLAQTALAQKPSGIEETYRRVEATFSQTVDVESLRDNPQFMAELKKVIGAADEDKTTWAQVVDYRGTKDGLYKWYNLNGIPAIFLVDGNGTIVAKGLRGSKIRETIVEYLNNH